MILAKGSFDFVVKGRIEGSGNSKIAQLGLTKVLMFYHAHKAIGFGSSEFSDDKKHEFFHSMRIRKRERKKRTNIKAFSASSVSKSNCLVKKSLTTFTNAFTSPAIKTKNPK